MPKVRAISKVTVRQARWQLMLSTMLRNRQGRVEVGLFDNAAITEYGFYNEFGTRTIPARSFIRSTLDQNRRRYQQIIEDGLNQAMLAGVPLTRMLNKLGTTQSRDIKRKITSLRTPPNAPSTIASKGFNNPLIETGAMRNAIRHRVIA